MELDFYQVAVNNHSFSLRSTLAGLAQKLVLDEINDILFVSNADYTLHAHIPLRKPSSAPDNSQKLGPFRIGICCLASDAQW